MLNFFPHVVDDEIVLQPLTQRYARPLFQLVDTGRYYLAQWQNWPNYIQNLQHMQGMIRRSEARRRSNTGLDAVILYQGEPAGKIGFVYIDWQRRQAEIGYWLGESYQGRGIMTRACCSLVDYGLMQMKLDVIHIRCAAGNLRSRYIPERLGFENKGILEHKVWLHNRSYDELLYAMTYEHWSNRMIYHITTRQAWEQGLLEGAYRPVSLESQGYIHFSRRNQVVKVANAVYQGQKDLVLLCVLPESVSKHLRYEPPDANIELNQDTVELFPHLYAALPITAVVDVVDFSPEADGTFRLPDKV